MRRLICLLVLAVVAGGFAGCPRRNPLPDPNKPPVVTPDKPPVIDPKNPPQFLSANVNGGYYRNGALDDAVSAPETEGDAGGEPREVVEPDVIRRDGRYLYILNQYRGLTIVDLDTETVTGRAATPGYPRDLYLRGGMAWVLSGYAAEVREEGGLFKCEVASRVYAVDVSNPAAPAVIGSLNLPGDFIDSRLVGDALYAVCANYNYVWQEGATADTPVSSPAKEQSGNSTWVTSVDLSEPGSPEAVGTVSFDGYGTLIQASNEAMFVAAPDWQANTTAVTYVDISDPHGEMAVRGAISVPGQITDRFKMDAWNGTLRLVTNTWWPERETDVITVDLSNPDALEVLGKARVENASGEALFATRFDGPRAYIVTYFMVDPLFVLDLSDPAAPKVAGELVVPGWSTHIEPRGDRLIALGVDDTNGRRVCVSLFDVADPAAPALLDRETFGDNWSWSAAYGDVKAFTVLEDLLVVPFSGWEEGAGGYDRLQFLAWDRGGVAPLGHVDVQGSVLRSLEYGSRYYGVTAEELSAIELAGSQPVVVNRVPLAEYIADYVPLDNGLAAEIVTSYAKNSTEVRVKSAPGSEPAGVVTLPGASFTAAFSLPGGAVALVSSGYDEANNYQGYYTVSRVDCTVTPPVAVWTTRVNMQPWYSGWWGGGWYGGPEVMVDAAMPRDAGGGESSEPGSAGSEKAAMYDMRWWPGYYYRAEDAAMLVNGKVVLQGWADSYGTVIGEMPPDRGLAVVDAATGALDGTAGFGIAPVAGVAAGPDGVYVTTWYSAAADSQGRAWCAYFLQVFHPETLTMGPGASVPGIFVRREGADGVIVTEDTQYGEGWNWKRVLNTLAWDGGGGIVEPLSALELPQNTGQILVRDGMVWFSMNDNAVQYAGTAVISTAGALVMGPKTAITDNYNYGQLLDARGNGLHVMLCGSLIVRYDYSESALVPALQTPVMGWPLRLRFNGDAVYAPMGNAGLAVY